MTENAIMHIENHIAEMKRQYIPILREIIINGRKLNDEQIVGRIVFAAQQKLDPISEVNTLVDRDGKTLGHTMHINGYRRICQEQAGRANEIRLDFMEMPAETLKKFPGALIGYICELREGSSYTEWQHRVTEVGKALREAIGQVTFAEIMQAVGNPPVFTGVGIFYQSELSEYKDKNFNPIERCKKRAELNARKKRFPTNAPIYENDNGAAFVIEGQFEDKQKDEPPQTTGEIMSDLGYDNPEPQPTVYVLTESDWTSEKISFATASTLKSSDGTLYISLDNKALEGRRIGLNKRIANNHLTPEEVEDTKLRLDVIDGIFQARGEQK